MKAYILRYTEYLHSKDISTLTLHPIKFLIAVFLIMACLFQIQNIQFKFLDENVPNEILAFFHQGPFQNFIIILLIFNVWILDHFLTISWASHVFYPVDIITMVMYIWMELVSHIILIPWIRLIHAVFVQEISRNISNSDFISQIFWHLQPHCTLFYFSWCCRLNHRLILELTDLWKLDQTRELWTDCSKVSSCVVWWSIALLSLL